MNKRTRRILKWLGIVLLFLVILLVVGEAIRLYLVLNPEYFFARQLRYKQYTVYSNRPIDPNIERVIDEALESAKQSERYVAVVILQK